MNLVFKSKLYREEIKHWLLFVILICWGGLASIFALKNNSKTILIGIDESGTRIVSESSDRILRNELRNFIKEFVLTYYGYNEKSFLNQMEQSSNLMTQELWEKLKPKLLELKSKLTQVPLEQIPDIESIDLLEQGQVEIILNLKVQSKINEQKVKLKVKLLFVKAKRTELNPWGYEVSEVSDAVL